MNSNGDITIWVGTVAGCFCLGKPMQRIFADLNGINCEKTSGQRLCTDGLSWGL
jgi:hypothetical protein